MKYGETTFIILYLIFSIGFGIYMIIKHKDKRSLLMGFASLILGLGDSFHLVPRVLNYFVEYDFNAALGIGKLITSITMTFFYLFMFHILKDMLYISKHRLLTISIYLIALVRIMLLALPGNDWINNSNDVLYGIIRNIPFTLLGLIIVLLYYFDKKRYNFKNIWIYITLSFIFYLIVVIGAPYVKLLGMFMIPKTICYMLIIMAFYNYMIGDKNENFSDGI